MTILNEKMTNYKNLIIQHSYQLSPIKELLITLNKTNNKRLVLSRHKHEEILLYADGEIQTFHSILKETDLDKNFQIQKNQSMRLLHGVSKHSTIYSTLEFVDLINLAIQFYFYEKKKSKFSTFLKEVNELHEACIELYRKKTTTISKKEMQLLFKKEIENNKANFKHQLQKEYSYALKFVRGNSDDSKKMIGLLNRSRRQRYKEYEHELKKLVTFWENRVFNETYGLWLFIKKITRRYSKSNIFIKKGLDHWSDKNTPTDLDRVLILYLANKLYPDIYCWDEVIVDEGHNMSPVDFIMLEAISKKLIIVGDIQEREHFLEKENWNTLILPSENEWEIVVGSYKNQSNLSHSKLIHQILYSSSNLELKKYTAQGSDDFIKIIPTYIKVGRSREFSQFLYQIRKQGYQIGIVTNTIQETKLLHEEISLLTQILDDHTVEIECDILIGELEYFNEFQMDAVLIYECTSTNFPLTDASINKIYKIAKHAKKDLIYHSSSTFSLLTKTT
ncbi:hypothetical protein [Exiguobacterium sp. s55]|uniref:hypothetical protein n=1 Tax=Exiguobacterium sp. s55 TaxID=2751245 RepID=UPI001BE82F22|nr:hypothetical protein [Exiguobacterium sp. s55]